MGFQTTRTCQAGAMLPAGCEEMVVDCFRMARDSDITGTDASSGLGGSDLGMNPRPPNNFEDGWEAAEFSPDYKTGRSSSSLSKNARGVTVERGTWNVAWVLKNTLPHRIEPPVTVGM